MCTIEALIGPFIDIPGLFVLTLLFFSFSLLGEL